MDHLADIVGIIVGWNRGRGRVGHIFDLFLPNILSSRISQRQAIKSIESEYGKIMNPYHIASPMNIPILGLQLSDTAQYEM